MLQNKKKTIVWRKGKSDHKKKIGKNIKVY